MSAGRHSLTIPVRDKAFGHRHHYQIIREIKIEFEITGRAEPRL